MPVTRRIEALLWHPRCATLPGAARMGIALLRHLYALLRDVTVGPLTLHAMGLVYVTILSVVPLLAVSLSVIKAIGFHRQAQPLLDQFLGPLGERGTELSARIISFVDNAQGDALAGAGTLFLLVAALSMADQVEGSFNQIWRVERPRSMARRASEYLALILLGPVVMVTALGLITALRSNALLGPLVGTGAFGPGGTLNELAPYLLVCLGFSFVYWFVPNAAVRGGAALLGGLFGGILWAGSGAIVANFVVNAATTLSIYATFAIAITALLWLYLSWLVLLMGAQLAFYVQHPDYMRIGYRLAVTGTAQKEQAAVTVMLLVSQAVRAGAGPPSLATIADETGLPGLSLAPVVARLEAAGLLAHTASGGLRPLREPREIRLRDIVRAVRYPASSDVGPEVRWPAAVATLNERLEASIEASVGTRTLESLL